MTMELYDGSNHDGLFDIQGKLFKAIGGLNTARGSTVPTLVSAALAQWALKTGLPLAYTTALEGLADESQAWTDDGDGLAAALSAAARNVLLSFAGADAGYALTQDAAVDRLILQMTVGGSYVTPSVVSVTVTPGSNTGDAVLAASVKRGDGKTQQYLLAETINGAANAGGGIDLASNPAADLLSAGWPAGSGLDFSLLPSPADTSLLPAGGFDAVDWSANVPDGWYVDVGTPGTTLFVSAPEVQTVAISGTPTGGVYFLIYTDAASRKWITTPLPFDAAASAVQAALREIPDLAAVTVSSAGTSPDLTHTITFSGLAGDVTTLASQNQLTGGSPTITHGTTTAGDALAFVGRSLILDSNGSELTKIAAPLTLAADTVYFVAVRLRRTGAASAGTFKIDVVNGFQGAAVTDSAGGSNAFTVAASAIPTSSTAYTFSIRVPTGNAAAAWLSLGFSVAVTSTATIYVDELSIVAGTQLYPGGPYVAAFAGKTAPVVGDSWSLAIANNRAGGVGEWFNRAFDLAARELLLPTSGSSLIPETVLS